MVRYDTGYIGSGSSINFREDSSHCAALNNIISGCDIADAGTDLTNTGNIFLS